MEKQRESKWTGMVHDTGYGSSPIAEMGKNLPSSSVLPDWGWQNPPRYFHLEMTSVDLWFHMDLLAFYVSLKSCSQLKTNWYTSEMKQGPIHLSYILTASWSSVNVLVQWRLGWLKTLNTLILTLRYEIKPAWLSFWSGHWVAPCCPAPLPAPPPAGRCEPPAFSSHPSEQSWHNEKKKMSSMNRAAEIRLSGSF